MPKSKKKIKKKNLKAIFDDDIPVEPEKPNYQAYAKFLATKQPASSSSALLDDFSASSDSDDDENAAMIQRKRSKREKPSNKQKADDEKSNAVTLFVGNVPLTLMKARHFLSLFKGKLPSVVDGKPNNLRIGHPALLGNESFSKSSWIESVRFRSFTPAQPKGNRKVSYIKRDFHHLRTSCNAYVMCRSLNYAKALVRFINEHTVVHNTEAVPESLMVDDHHLRADIEGQPSNTTSTLSVFIGNIPFECEEEIVYKFFEQQECYPQQVRLIRDSATGIGRGFGYVSFSDASLLELALSLDGQQLTTASGFSLPIRIKPAHQQSNNNNKREKPKRSHNAAKRIQRSQNSTKYTPEQAVQRKLRKIKRKKQNKFKPNARQKQSVAPSWQGMSAERRDPNKKRKRKQRRNDGGHSKRQKKL
mmetsp:Transcript_16406/g.24492  ORF Transcript_16406/g.24492 Transcript_16406/m.24492 type:complete len:418 (+) Transcript_16406:272-1525(+)